MQRNSNNHKTSTTIFDAWEWSGKIQTRDIDDELIFLETNIIMCKYETFLM